MSSMACGHNDELVALGAMHLLSAEEQARLDERVSTCPDCRKRLQEYRALAAAMPRLMMPEMSPSRAITTQAPPRLNGKTPHISMPFSMSNGWEEPTVRPIPMPEPLSSSRLEHLSLGQRMVSFVSGLAAVVLLVGLIGGFWLLLVGRTPGGSYPIITIETPQATQVISNPCGAGASGDKGASCGLVLLDTSTIPAQLVEADPVTGQVMPELPPLPVGNATLASLSADYRVLVLGVTPYQYQGTVSLQIVHLDNWSLGAKATVQLAQGMSLQNLAITPNGTGVYAVIVDANGSQAVLRYYAYDRGHETLAPRWSAPLPFAPGDANSFALSSDGTSAYLFSAKVTPPQVDTIMLGADGISSPQQLPLPSIAPEGQAPAPNAPYNPNEPIPSVYQPAAIFMPDLNKLYLIHAEAKSPQNDVLVVIDLTKPKASIGSDDIPITEAGQTLADANEAISAGGPMLSPSLAFSPTLTASASGVSLAIQPQQATRPAKGEPYTGRSEQGTISSDGRWIYLTGTTFTPASAEGGVQSTGMGIMKIDTQTGHVIGHWFQGNAYSTLTVSPNGKTLYVFGDPYTEANNPNVATILALDAQQGTLLNTFESFTSCPFLFVLR